MSLIDKTKPAETAIIPLTPATPNPGIIISKPNKSKPKTNKEISKMFVFPIFIDPQKKAMKQAIERIPDIPKPGVKTSKTAVTIATISKIAKM